MVGEEEGASAEVVAVVRLLRSILKSQALTIVRLTGRGGFQQSYGPPAAVLGESYRCLIHSFCLRCSPEMGTFMHACEGEIVCESVNPKVPYFNAPIYLENKVGHSNSTM